jgi:chemotaxis protein MotB
MIDARELSIVLRDGRMVLRMPNDVLFDSGSVVVKPAGLKVLGVIAGVLKSVSDRRFQVAGHTDSVPIATPRFASNWDLSTARAVEVVRVLATHGLRQPLLSAAGYGEFDPVASNDTNDGRARNRRIEIAVQPNINELVILPDQ